MPTRTVTAVADAAAGIAGPSSCARILAVVIVAAGLVSESGSGWLALFYAFPAPPLGGLEGVARGYAQVGMRAGIAPMMGERTFWCAIPGVVGALPPEGRAEV